MPSIHSRVGVRTLLPLALVLLLSPAGALAAPPWRDGEDGDLDVTAHGVLG